MDYEIQRPTRHCSQTGRELRPGERFFSMLVRHEGKLQRRDFSADAWTGPPEDALGWWRSQVPLPEAGKPQLAPNDVMLDLLEQLADAPDKQDLRYVLALLLVRRRALRLEDTEQSVDGEVLVLFCPRREVEYRIIAALPDDRRTTEIQNELAELLFAEAT